MKTALAVVAVAAVLGLGCTPAWAVLGEYENSVASDQQVMRGDLRLQLFSPLDVTKASLDRPV